MKESTAKSANSESGQPSRTSRFPGFYASNVAERLAALEPFLDPSELSFLRSGGKLSFEIADKLSENVIATHALPYSVAANFLINGRDVILPMSVEEPSVVAAASHAAKLVRNAGGFEGYATAPVMTAQVQVDAASDPENAQQAVEAVRDEIRELADKSIPRMVQRGGGFVDLETRVVDQGSGSVVVDLHINVGDAMGANMVDTVSEAVAPLIARTLGAEIGLRILTNLPLRRRAVVHCRIPETVFGGKEQAERFLRAARFAEQDIFRAVTHNKGIMNGVDACALAFGQDWRAIEAAAHGFAALGESYRPLSTWEKQGDGVVGKLEMPMAVGTVGGLTRVHPGVAVSFALAQPRSSQELSVYFAAAGLASNLAALKALSGEGIQAGHMKLHARKANHKDEL